MERILKKTTVFMPQTNENELFYGDRVEQRLLLLCQ